MCTSILYSDRGLHKIVRFIFARDEDHALRLFGKYYPRCRIIRVRTYPCGSHRRYGHTKNERQSGK